MKVTKSVVAIGVLLIMVIASNVVIINLVNQNNTLQGDILSDKTQIGILQSENAHLQGTIANLTLQLQNATIVGQAYELSTCFLIDCSTGFFGAWTNLGTLPTGPVTIQFVGYSLPDAQGSQVCTATYVLGIIPGRSVVSMNPSQGQYAICTYVGTAIESFTWSVIQQ